MSPIQQTMFEEAAQSEINAAFQSYFENSEDALLLLSDRGTILKANNSVTRLCLYEPEELGNSPLDALFPELIQNGLVLPLHVKLSDRPLISVSTRIHLKTGEPQSVDLFICQAPDTGQDACTYQVLVKKRPEPNGEDKSSQTRLNAERLKSIGALAGGIAHNFNNIMTGLYGNITLAKLEAREKPKVLAHLQKAESSMEEAVRLTRQLLTFAKGGSPLKEYFNPVPMIRDIAGLNLAGSDVRIELTAPEDLWLIHADKKQLEQVVGNIVVNARQAMNEQGTLCIEISNSHLLKDNLLTIAKGAYIKLVFRDQGEGISEKYLNRIFDPYFTTRQDACGMGLSICYSIVNRHKGHLTVASQLGEGTVATVYLPARIKTRPNRRTAADNSRQADGRASILVVDDETPVRAITQKILENAGYKVSLARDGQEAVALYREAMKENVSFDLMIMDVKTPGDTEKLKTVKTILDIDPSARIAATTGDAGALALSGYKDLGLTGVITRPYGFEELTGAVRQLLAS